MKYGEFIHLYTPYPVTSLADIASFQTGFPQVARVELNLSDAESSGYVPAVGLSAITPEGGVDWLILDRVHPPQSLKPEHRLAAGDIVVSARGSAAKIGMVLGIPAEPIFSTTNVIVVRPNQELVDPTYLWACLTKLRHDPREVFFARGSTQVWSITLRDLARLPINLPPLEEQRRIASTVQVLRAAADSARAVATQYDHTLSVFLSQFLSSQIKF